MVGTWNSIIIFIFLGLGWIPSLLITWPKKLMDFFAKLHLLRLCFRLTSLDFYNTHLMCFKCLAQYWLWTLKSLKNTFKNLSMYFLNTFPIVWEKTLVVFFNPNGINVQLKSLDLIIKVIFFMSLGSILIC
jgi:hypothetical protein